MSDILLYYRRPDPTTWVYMSSFLTIGLYFVFHRFWSMRNLDIVLLILLAPGMLMVHEGRRQWVLEAEKKDAVAAQRSQTPVPDDDRTQNGEDDQAGKNRPSSKVLVAFHQDASDDDLQQGESPKAADAQPSGDDDSKDDANDESMDAEAPGTDAAEGDGADVAVTDPNIVGADDEVTPLSDSGYTASEIQRLGFITLFVVQALILIRLMLDPLKTRRPLLDPNLSIGGLNFIGISMFIFMMANVVASNPRLQATQGPQLGPGYALMNMLPAIPTRPVSDALGSAAPPTEGELTSSQARLAMIAKVLAIVAQMAVVTGIVLIGNRHFGNLRAGVGCATLYLMMPYTAQMTGRVDHAVPAALLVWALLLYRKPILAGSFFGLAGGLVYYPLFLLPLWVSFYWKRGAGRFATGVAVMLAVLMVLLSLAGTDTLVEHLRLMFGLFSPFKEASELRGFWQLGLNPIWRLPVIVGFVILSMFFAVWPAQKNLGTLLSGSAAVMVAAQFWHGYGGGLYIAWFLPFLLLTIFRPNLEDRVAIKVVDESRSGNSSRESRLEAEAA